MKLVSITNAVKIKNQRIKPFLGEREYMATGGLVGSKIKTTKVTYKTKPSRADLLVSINQLIVARMKGTNKVLLVDKNNCDLIVSTGFLVLEVQTGWDPGFLYHFFVSSFFQNQKNKYSIGATQKAINNNKFKNILIPAITLEDQKRIVKIFDKADSLCKKRKQSIELLDDYLKSVFFKMFGDPVNNEKDWEIKTLKNVTTKLGDGLHGTPKFSDTGDYYFVNGNNLENGKILIKDSTKRVTYEEYKKYQKPLNETSILVSINGTLGRVAFYNNEKIILGKSACYFNIKKNEVNPIYLYNILRSDFFLRYADKNSTGSTIKNVSLKTMREFPIIYPPIDLQDMFGNVVAKIEKVKVLMISQSEELETQFQALIYKVFKGDL